MAKLKVYRTPIGFHDAYVAAPSQKAALAAWGSEHDLFARKIASIVTDPALTEEPLARPGEVIKRSRGTTAEQLAALPPDTPRQKKKPADKSKAKANASAPDRTALDAAEAALARAAERHREEQAELAAERDRLQQRQERLDREYREEINRLESTRARAAAAFERG